MRVVCGGSLRTAPGTRPARPPPDVARDRLSESLLVNEVP